MVDSRGRRIAALLLLLVLLAVAHLLLFRVVDDDAFISLRVVRHWVRHGVPEYNPGVREWVPTSFGWVGLLAGIERLVPVPLPLLAQVLGTLAAVATIVLLALGFPALGAAGPWAAALCALSSVWAAWPLSGMETSLFSLAVLTSVWALLRAIEAGTWRRAGAAGLACGAATLVRPEGALLAAVSLVVLVAATRDGRRALWFALGGALVVVPAVIYLGVTFGTVLPVSAYAKLHGLGEVEGGLRYFAAAARTYRLAYFLPLALLAPLARRARPAAALALGLCALWIGVVALEGGDFMPYHRFLNPVWPLWALAAGLGLAWVGGRLAALRRGGPLLSRAATGLLALLAAFSWAAPSWRGAERKSYDDSAIDELARGAIGAYLERHVPASEWIAVKPAGIIPYYSGLRAVDFFCITDLRAARTGAWVPGAWPGHQRMNPGRIHDLAPKIVILEARLYPLDLLPPPDATDPNHGASWLADPRAARYAPVRAEVLPDLWLDLFVRR